MRAGPERQRDEIFCDVGFVLGMVCAGSLGCADENLFDFATYISYFRNCRCRGSICDW